MARYTNLTFGEMKRTSEMLPEYFISVVQSVWGRDLKAGEYDYLSDNGVVVAFTGNNPPQASEVRYVLFLRNISRRTPFVVNINAHFAVTDAHQNIITRFKNPDVITAGNLTDGRFSEISSEWVTRYTRNKPDEYYHFGLMINKLMLKTLQIGG